MQLEPTPPSNLTGVELPPSLRQKPLQPEDNPGQSSAADCFPNAGFVRRLYEKVVTDDPSIFSGGEKLFQGALAFLETRSGEEARAAIEAITALSSSDRELVLLFSPTKNMFKILADETGRTKDESSTVEKMHETMITIAVKHLPGRIQEALDLYNEPMFVVVGDPAKKICVTSTYYNKQEIAEGVQSIDKALQLIKELSPEHYQKVSSIDGFILLPADHHDGGISLGGASDELPGCILLSYPFFKDANEDISNIHHLIAIINEEADHNKMHIEGPYDHELVAEDSLDYKLPNPSILVKDPTIYNHIFEARAAVSNLELLDKAREHTKLTEERKNIEELTAEELSRLGSKLEPLLTIDEKMLTKKGRDKVNELKNSFGHHMKNVMQKELSPLFEN